MRLPLHPLVAGALANYGIVPSQLAPKDSRVLITFAVLYHFRGAPRRQVPEVGSSRLLTDHRRFKRIASNKLRAPCGMCSQDVEVGEVAYNCRDDGCTFVLHDACYRRPRETKHFAHSWSGRPLTLSDKHPAAAAGGRPSSFTVRSALHPQHALTLLAPPPGAGGGRRTCLNTIGRSCNNAGRNNDAWSYRCNLCRVELCLKSQLPNGGGGHALETMAVVGQQLATMTGTSLRAFGCACIGTPMAPPALPPPAST
ncbi:hypothetical protein C2845_PM13G23970 [Panicum miliaceum]|uniref:DC1 domain-containing protein n=1 Tax=Panicum miliaceum TaxID=4540 RepID=A0A3L6RLY7_PANMI|nr:hypothetical protein C2845_PM13G23970 [Panicum miliaceum]